jgi:hypothetical protein
MTLVEGQKGVMTQSEKIKPHKPKKDVEKYFCRGYNPQRLLKITFCNYKIILHF